MHCYCLSFTAPLHIDSRGDAFHERTETFIHSDTLSAALLSAWALLDPDGAEHRAKAPPFCISSAFPYYQDHYFLPRAMTTSAVTLNERELKKAKDYKKVQWLELDLWRQSFQNGWLDKLAITQSCLGFVKPAPQLKQLWAEEQRPRLAVDRLSNSASAGQLFHLSRVWFDPLGGLYFLATFANKQDQSQFEAALSVLADSGIGADRNNGNGFFTWRKPCHAPKLTLALVHEPAVALSLVNPNPDVDCANDWLEGSAYKLISRGGWIGQSGLRKNRLRLFAEGSVFKRPLQGRVVDITPNKAPNPVYRDGRGFFIKAG